MFESLGLKDAQDIAEYIMARAKDDKLSVTLTVEPMRYELRVEPWENVAMLCPYRGKCDVNE